MRAVRGVAPDVERDRAATDRLAGLVEETNEPAIRVWTPPRQVAFGRRDATTDGYQQARDAALEYGYEPIERRVGGRAVAYTGETVAFVYAVPVDGTRDGIGARYRETTDLLERSLESIGATVRRGEPDEAFCPGDHSLRGTGADRNGGKIAGVAQRVRRGSALVGGCVVVKRSDERELRSVLEPVYSALESPFDRSSVGSVESAGGPGDVEAVIEAIESAFVDSGSDRGPERTAVSELLE
jgi:lipoate-protein ligase A